MNQPRTQLTVRTAADILDVVPTLLGFIPTESLVVIYLDAIHGRSQIAMTARMDLPVTHDELTTTLQVVEHHARKHEAMILVAYSADTTAADHTLRYLLDKVSTIEVKVAVSASADGWAELGVAEPSHRQPYREASSQVTTAILEAGLQRPAWTREDISESVQRPRLAGAAAFGLLVKSAEPLSCEQLTAWLRHWTDAGSGHSVDAADAATLVASLQNIRVRDAAWAAITCADAGCHINLWRQVSLLVDGAAALPVLGLLGMAAWIGGQGAMANMVLDRAATTEGYSEYTLFGLLHTVLEAGVDPRQWDSMRLAMSTGSAT